MSVFDGLDDIFTETFGESVIYTPVSTGMPVSIQAIWIEHPLEIQFENASVDGARTELSVRARDIPAPAELDIAQRVSDGKIMKVSTPIQPDGKGMIVCNLTK